MFGSDKGICFCIMLTHWHSVVVAQLEDMPRPLLREAALGHDEISYRCLDANVVPVVSLGRKLWQLSTTRSV